MTDYTVSAEFTLRDWVSPVLDKIIERLDNATKGVSDFQVKLDRLNTRGITRLLAQFDKLQRVTWPTQLVEGADKFEGALSAADRQMADLTKHAQELARTLKDLKAPKIPDAPGGHAPGGGGGRGGRGGHGGGDPIMAGIEGGAVLEFLGENFDRFATVDQVYRAMQSDTSLQGPNNPRMAAILGQAKSQLERFRTLKPLDVAKNAGEAYTISGGNLAEQPALANMLDRLEQNLVLRGKDPEEAQRQATAVLRGLDVGNRFFNRKTGEFDQSRADAEADRVLSMISASNGLMSGQNYLAFMKSAGLAGQNLSLEGMAKMAHFIDINPSRSGTALKSFENLFGGHATRMTKKDKAAWTAAGLYDKHGVLVDNDMLMGPNADPFGWIEKHQKQLTSVRINDRTQRQNVASFLAETQGAQGNINRGAAAVARSDANANGQNLLDSPRGKILQFEAAMDRFRTTLGRFEAGPGTKILNSLTDGLAKLDDVLEKHPQATDLLIKLTAALAGFMVIRGVVALTGLGEGITMLSRGLGLFAKGSAAEAALETMTASAGAGSLFGLSAALVALGAAVIALPPIGNKLLGKRDEDPGPAANAHGMPYAGPRPAGPTPQQRMQDGLDGISHDLAHPQSHGNSRGLPTQHTTYRTEVGSGMTHMQPIAFTLVMPTGETLFHHYDMHQTRVASRPSPYGNSPDQLEVAPRPGMPLVAF